MNERQRQLRWVALIGASAIALYLCWMMLQPFLEVLAWAVVLVTFFFPVHQRLRREVHNPILCAFVSTTIVVLVILIPLTFITTALAQELSNAVHNLQNVVAGRASRVSTPTNF